VYLPFTAGSPFRVPEAGSLWAPYCHVTRSADFLEVPRLARDTKYGVHDNDIHNFDETSFQMGIIGSIKVVIGIERRARPELV
jgi:hypothetical protein